MVEERRVTTGYLLAALVLIVVGVVIGWATDTGEDGDRGADATADVGPTETVNGVPVGYERSREGAVAAALNYATVLARPEFITDAGRRADILEAVATPEAAQRYGREDYTGLAQTPVYRATREGKPSVWQTTPLGYRVEGYTEDEARVFTWSMAIVGAGRASPVATFGTGSRRLVWRDGDWKFAGDVGSTRSGPTPALAETASPTSTEQFRARLRALEGLRYVP